MKIVTHLRMLFLWLKGVALWATGLKKFWICVAGVCVPLAVVYGAGVTSGALLYAGYILEMLGLGLTLHAIIGLNAHFNRPSPFKSTLKAFPTWPKVHNEALTLEAKMGVIQLESSVGALELTKQLPIEEQVKKLTNDVRLLKKDMQRVRSEIEQCGKATDDKLMQAKNDLVNRISQAESKLEEAHTGGVELSLVGLVWLAAGLTLSTLSEDIASLWLS